MQRVARGVPDNLPAGSAGHAGRGGTLSPHTASAKACPRSSPQGWSHESQPYRNDRPVSAAVADRRAVHRPFTDVPGWWADVAGSAAVLSLLVVTALWTADRGVQELLGGLATGLTSAGRLTGLLKIGRASCRERV